MARGKVDEVVEVDRLLPSQQLLIALPHLLEDIKEALAAPAVGGSAGALARWRRMSEPTPLVLTWFRNVAKSLPSHEIFCRASRWMSDRREERPNLTPASLQLRIQDRLQRSLPVLPAVGLYQPRAMLPVQAPLPVDALGVPFPARRWAPVFVQREVLDVQAILGKVEVRPVLPVLSRGGGHLVGRFVPELDAALRQVVRNPQLLEALDQIATQRAQFDAPHVLLVAGLRLEVEGRTIGGEVVRDERGDRVGLPGVLEELPEDVIDGCAELGRIAGESGYGRPDLTGLANDTAAKGVKGEDVCCQTRSLAAARVSPPLPCG